MIYSKEISQVGNEFIVRQNLDGSVSNIPCDPANSDYQRYLAWLENPNAEEHLQTIVPMEGAN